MEHKHQPFEYDATPVRPLFSILHTSARPDKWREIYDAWIKAAVNPEQVEYVLCVDERWGFGNERQAFNDWLLSRIGPDEADEPRPWMPNVLTWNRARKCYVDGVNTAAQASTGRILIVNADDQYPREGWDEQLWAEIRLHYMIPDHEFLLTKDFVAEVSTGTPSEHERGILVMPILSRARYERLGYVLYPEYESMFSDNEFCEHARQDNCIIDARHLFFPHRHPLFDASARKPGKAWNETDEAYAVQNRAEAYQLGSQLLEIRRQEQFDPSLRHDIAKQEPVKQKTIVLCLSGEHFHREWVRALMDLHNYLGSKGWRVWQGWEYTSNVYVTREQIRRVMMTADPTPDLYLWIDDDNPAPTPEQFDLLLADLETEFTWPDGTVAQPDGVTGWCWIYGGLLSGPGKASFYPSCGMWSPDNRHWRPFDVVDFPKETKPRPVECTGFPCFLMRHSALEKAGPNPFLPILDDLMDHGLTGEDHAFCHRALEGGARFLAEPRVRVRHLKVSDAVPDVLMAPPVEPKVAVMMRVKDEARWIERSIQSVIPFAGSNIFVLDDESTDGTFELLKAMGVNVYRDPFAGEPLDETRDKDWLLEQVKASCNPDWVLCIDGDEELEPDGADRLLQLLRRNPAAECYDLGFLYLWNSPDTMRVDGRFRTLGRPSLFRVKEGITFRSYYEGKGVNEGFHCGNAPKELQSTSVNVALLHYGYMLRQDRIRKYEWYNRLDPNNEIEDRYRHIVQGDIPEVPAFEKLKHAGPLKLTKLTPSMVPKITLPGPTVAVIMRVRNEARWLERAIASVKPLAGANIFVMEQGSTDNSRDVIRQCGVHLVDNPFASEPFSEPRDRNWLKDYVIQQCHPDWILALDGDEELQADSTQAILNCLRDAPEDVGVVGLPWISLWNSVEYGRTDGAYGQFVREVLFRPHLDFVSAYATGYHSGIARGSMRALMLPVSILHYGTLHREDRIRKYRWISERDPHNETEDFYRHMVQGDIPEVPASLRLKLAGPLRLTKLRPEIMPRWTAPVPGPFEQPVEVEA